jgi:hypothetical protein
MKAHRITALFLALAFFTGQCWAADAKITPVPEPYTKESVPQWARDLRRAEIISFGSLPFVTLGVTMGFSLIRFAANDFNMGYFPNPMAKTTDSAGLTMDDQLTILGVSAVISVAFGLTDLIVTQVQRGNARRRQQAGGITINRAPKIEVYADENDPR